MHRPGTWVKWLRLNHIDGCSIEQREVDKSEDTKTDVQTHPIRGDKLIRIKCVLISVWIGWAVVCMCERNSWKVTSHSHTGKLSGPAKRLAAWEVCTRANSNKLFTLFLLGSSVQLLSSFTKLVTLRRLIALLCRKDFNPRPEGLRPIFDWNKHFIFHIEW